MGIGFQELDNCIYGNSLEENDIEYKSNHPDQYPDEKLCLSISEDGEGQRDHREEHVWRLTE